MSWILITIIAYLLFSITFLIDKYILVGSVIDPKVYTFYVALLGLMVFLFVPFVGFYLPDSSHLFFALLSGAAFVPALFLFNTLLSRFEASRVVPAVGGIVPIFILIFGCLISPDQIHLNSQQLASLVLLIMGSVLINYKPHQESKTDLRMWKMIIVSSALFALASLSSKYAFNDQDFFVILIWIRIGWFLTSLFFLLDKDVRKKILDSAKTALPQKAKGLFVFNQLMGAASNFLLNWVISIVSISLVAIVNAMQGMENVFLFIFSIMLSKKFPLIFQEDLAFRTILQKVSAILLIGSGLAILSI
jgi:drug/metabolite transporter (DMT)-like permease